MNDIVEEAGTSEMVTAEQPKPSEIIFKWWQELSDRNKALSRSRRAELRRAKSVEEICFSHAYHDLRRRLAAFKWNNDDRIAVVAAVLAQVVCHDSNGKVAAQMARPKTEGSGPKVSDARFRRLLLHVRDNEQLLSQMTRILGLLRDGSGPRVNVGDLAVSLYWWNEKIRKRWALAYYEKLS